MSLYVPILFLIILTGAMCTFITYWQVREKYENKLRLAYARNRQLQMRITNVH